MLEKIFGEWKDFAHSLGCGLGYNYVLLDEDLQKKVFYIAENREDFGHGKGFGLAEISFI
jgi:hypothetical protein